MDCNNIPARLIRNVGLLAVLALLTACDIGSRELRIYVLSLANYCFKLPLVAGTDRDNVSSTCRC
jgi:hypothetical protein